MASRLPQMAQRRWNGSSQAVFQEAKKRRQRARALAMPEADEYEYLREEVAERLADRLLDITREFPVAADVGCNSGHMLKAIGSRGGIQHLDQVETCAAAATRAKAAAREVETRTYCHRCASVRARRQGVPVEDSACTPLAATVRTLVTDDMSGVLVPGTYDLVMSSMSLHWSNDLPAKLKAMARSLKPDGAFLCAMLGGDTLRELRCASFPPCNCPLERFAAGPEAAAAGDAACGERSSPGFTIPRPGPSGAFVLAEQERLGGVAPHTSPLAQVSDLGNLLGQAGLQLTTGACRNGLGGFTPGWRSAARTHGRCRHLPLGRGSGHGHNRASVR